MVKIIFQSDKNKKASDRNICGFYQLVSRFAEREGFEPPDLLQSIVFKTIAIDHSAISPLTPMISLFLVVQI